LGGRLFGESFEVQQGALPERVEVVAQVCKARWIERMDVARTDSAVLDEAGGSQDGEVLRDSGAGNGKEAGEFRDRSRRGGDSFEDLAARGGSASAESEDADASP